jgi:hypothetical protein
MACATADLIEKRYRRYNSQKLALAMVPFLKENATSATEPRKEKVSARLEKS